MRRSLTTSLPRETRRAWGALFASSPTGTGTGTGTGERGLEVTPLYSVKDVA